LRAAGAKTLTAKYWPSGRGLERHGVGFAALVASDIEALPLASSPAATRSAKILAPRISTSFTAFRLAQVPLLVILLFAFGKREGLAAFGASDVNVWHDWFLPSKQSASLYFDLW
jgi:hypothetical protein